MLSSLAFLKEAVRHPKQLGAIAPTGQPLARAIVEAAGIEPGQRIVELGAGTGPITRAILERHPHHDVLALEPNAELAALLRQNLPDVEVCERLAEDLPAMVEERGWGRIPRVVSGLPWAIWPQEVQDAILGPVTSTMDPDGVLVTFAYIHGPYLPAGKRFLQSLHRYFSTVDKTPVVWRNVPPAFVYVCSKPTSASRT